MVQSQKHFIPEGLGEKVIGHDIWKFTNESRAKRLSTRLTISKHGGASRRRMMRQPEHWTGKREHPTAAGVIGFVLLLAIIPEFILPFVFESVGAHMVGIILIILTIVGLCACTEELEENEGKHKPEDEWTASSYWEDK